MRKTKSRRTPLPESPNVLVVATGAPGELLATTPALRAFRKAYPKSRVTAMVCPESAPVLVGNPNVDRLLPLDRKRRSGALGLAVLSTWIRAQHFDLALVYHTSFQSALTAAMGWIPRRAGLSNRGRGFLLTDAATGDGVAYEIGEHLKVPALLGVEPDGLEMELRLTDDERAEGRSLLGESGGRVAAICPGADTEIGRWPAERFAELGARLSSEHGITPVYIMGPHEIELGEAVAAWWRARDLAEPATAVTDNVRTLAGAFVAADIVVANGDGPVHFAAAVGAPSVFVYGPTPVERRHPPGDRHRAVAGDVACRPCDSPTCGAPSLACMEAVSVESVLAAAVGLLDKGAV